MGRSFGSRVVPRTRGRAVALAALTVALVAAIAWPWAPSEHRATAVMTVGAEPSADAPRARVDARAVEGRFVDALIADLVAGRSRFVAFDAEAHGAAAAGNAVLSAVRRVRWEIESRVPEPDAAREQVSADATRVDAARVDVAATEAQLAEWRALKGSEDPTELRFRVESELAALRVQAASDNVIEARAAQRDIPQVQQRTFELESAELRLRELTQARDDAVQSLGIALASVAESTQVVALAESDAELVGVGAVRIDAVDPGATFVRRLIALVVLGCAIALGSTAVVAYRTRRFAYPYPSIMNAPVLTLVGEDAEPEIDLTREEQTHAPIDRDHDRRRTSAKGFE